MEGTSQGVGTEASVMVSKVVSTCSDSKTPDIVQVVNSWKSPLVGGSSGLWLPISSCTNSADGVGKIPEFVPNLFATPCDAVLLHKFSALIN